MSYNYYHAKGNVNQLKIDKQLQKKLNQDFIIIISYIIKYLLRLLNFKQN